MNYLRVPVCFFFLTFLYRALCPTSVWYLYLVVLASFFFYFQKDPGFCKPSGKMLMFWLAGDLYSHPFCFYFLYFPP